jgi:dolichol-phosphate mannosyltransferase
LASTTLVVLPTYNEAANLARLVDELRRTDAALDLLIVDDESPDGTGRIADELAARLPRVEVVHRAGKLGLGSAHILGMRRADEGGYRILVTMDCDYTHLPRDVPRVVAALDERQADVAVGSRYVDPASMHDWPLPRRLITRAAHLCTRRLLGIPGDATSGFRAYRVAALRRVPYAQVRGDGYSFIFELLFVCLRAGLVVVEVPVRTPIRQAGESKISRLEIARAVATLLRLWRAGGARG